MQAKLAVSVVSLSDLVPDPNNARDHGPRNIEAIKASLLEFGQVSPLVVQESSGRVIGGNGTLRAMKSLGWEAAEVVTVDVDNQTAKAMGLALNRTAELATWNIGILEGIIDELAPRYTPEAVGFSTDELDAILHRPGNDDGIVYGEGSGDGGGRGQGEAGTREPGRGSEKAPATGAKELSEDEFAEFKHTCPRCGFEFDKPMSTSVGEDGTEAA